MLKRRGLKQQTARREGLGGWRWGWGGRGDESSSKQSLVWAKLYCAILFQQQLVASALRTIILSVFYLWAPSLMQLILMEIFPKRNPSSQARPLAPWWKYLTLHHTAEVSSTVSELWNEFWIEGWLSTHLFHIRCEEMIRPTSWWVWTKGEFFSPQDAGRDSGLLICSYLKNALDVET